MSDARGGGGNASAGGAGGASETASTGPAPKRMRVSRACEQCRSRKAKCDGKTPTCSPCVTLSQQCTYGAQPRKRGLPPGSVSALERTVKLLQRVLGLLIVSVEGSENAILGLVQRCGKNLFDDGEEGKRLSSAWKEGLVPEALELLREKSNGAEAVERSPAAGTEVQGTRTEAAAGGAGGGNGAEILTSDLGLAQEHFQEAIRAISSGVEGPRSAALEGDVTRRAENSRDRDEGIGPTEMDWVKESQSVQESERERDNARSRESQSTTQLSSNIDTSLANNINHSYQNHMGLPVVTPPLFPSDNNPFPDQMPNPSMSDQAMHDSVIPNHNHTFRPISYQQSAPLESPVRDNFIIPQREQDYPQLPSNSRLLLDLYFAYTHVWFPILDKYDLIRFFHVVNSSSSSKRKAHPTKTEIPSGKRALLYAVLALATIQNDGLSQATSSKTAPPQSFLYTPSPASQSAPASPSAPALYTAAQKLIFKPGEEYSLEHVQALLLLSLVNIALSHLNASWLLIGHAGRVAVDIGLKSETKSRFNTRTWLGYLVLETFISVRLGRNPPLREEDWAVPIVEEDGWEEWEEWKEVPAADPRSKRDINLDDHGNHDQDDPAHILSVFNQLAKLSRVVRRVASIPPSKQPPEYNQKHDRREEGILPPQNILHQLQSWCRDLLPHCSFDVLNPMEIELPVLVPTAPHISNLHLLYAHAILELHNRSRSFSDYGLNPQNPVSSSASAAAASTTKILEYVKSARSLAVAPCTFIHFAGLVSNDSPSAVNDEIGPFTPIEKSISARGRTIKDELEKNQYRAKTGFPLCKGLLKMTTEVSKRQKQDVPLARPHPPRQPVDVHPRLMSQSDDSTFGGQLAMSPSRLFHSFTSPAPMISSPGNISATPDSSNPFRRSSFQVPPRIDSVSQEPNNNSQHAPTLQALNMRTMQQQQEDNNSTSSNINNAYNQPGPGSQAASLSLSTHTAPSPDGFDEEMGMLECLPWSQNGLPEFVQNLGYVGGFSPSAFQLGHSGHEPEQAPLQILGLRQESAGTHTDEGGGGGYDGGEEGAPAGGSGGAGDDTNIMSGRRGLNTVLEQWLGDVLGAGGNGRWT